MTFDALALRQWVYMMSYTTHFLGLSNFYFRSFFPTCCTRCSEWHNWV